VTVTVAQAPVASAQHAQGRDAMVPLWSHRGYTVVVLLLYCCYAVVALFLRCCYTGDGEHGVGRGHCPGAVCVQQAHSGRGPLSGAGGRDRKCHNDTTVTRR
jgi:hypothetical protein